MANLINLAEAARMLGIESAIPKREGNRLWELIRQKKVSIPYRRSGRLYRFDPDEIREWLRHMKTGRG